VSKSESLFALVLLTRDSAMECPDGVLIAHRTVDSGGPSKWLVRLKRYGVTEVLATIASFHR